MVDGDGLLVTGPKPPDDLLADLRTGKIELIRLLNGPTAEAKRAAIFAIASSDEDRAFLNLDWAYADQHAERATSDDVAAARTEFEKVRKTW